mgnify:FL=1
MIEIGVGDLVSNVWDKDSKIGIVLESYCGRHLVWFDVDTVIWLSDVQLKLINND